MTFPGGTHDLWIRYWPAAGGIDPDKDVSTIVVPPPQMVANMKVGNMDAFCVGEPWNEQLVNQGIGFTACTTGEVWFRPSREGARHARRVGRQESRRHARAADGGDGSAAVVREHGQQGRALGHPRQAPVVQRAARRHHPAASKGDINYGRGRKESGTKLFMKFWEDGTVSYPWKSHDTWFVTEDIRWGKFAPNTDIKALVDKVNREDIWREAATALGIKSPASTSRGKETFFDGKVFDPDNPAAYLASLAITRVTA